MTSSIFVLWLLALPLLIDGLMIERRQLIASAAALLLGSTVLQAVHMVQMVRRVRTA